MKRRTGPVTAVTAVYQVLVLAPIQAPTQVQPQAKKHLNDKSNSSQNFEAKLN